MASSPAVSEVDSRPRRRAAEQAWSWLRSRWAFLPLGVVFVATLLKGLVVTPHDWAILHHFLNYSHGLVKRGLVGTLLMPVLAGRTGANARAPIEVVAWLSMAAFVLLALWALATLVRRPESDRVQRIAHWMVALAFAASPFVWQTGIALGYFDSLVACLMLLAVPAGRLRLQRFVPLALIAILVHEIAGLWMVPLLLLYPLSPGPGWSVDSSRFKRVAIALVAFVAVATLCFSAHPSPALFDEMRRRGVSTNFWVGIVQGLLNDSLRGAIKGVGARDLLRPYTEGLLIYMAPSWIGLIWGEWQILQSSLARQAKLLWAAVFAVAALSSAASVLIAFDFSRLFALSNLQAFLAYTVLVDRLESEGVAHPSSPDRRETRWAYALVLLTALVVVGELLTTADFTFMAPRPRVLSHGWSAWGWDPMRHLVSLINTKHTR